MILCVNIYINIIIIATINSAGGGVQLKLGKNKKKYMYNSFINLF